MKLEALLIFKFYRFTIFNYLHYFTISLFSRVRGLPDLLTRLLSKLTLLESRN